MKAQGAGNAQRRARRVLRPTFERMWDFDLSGLERLPADGPAILCPNHISFLDSVFVAAFVPRNISFVGKAEYMDSWKTKYIFPMLGMIPIDRSGGSKSQAALDAAQRVLERGELFGMFPEGTRSRDGLLYKGRTGAARLALTVGCPIYPVGIVGTDAIQPPDAKFPKLRGHCSITIGRPVRMDRYKARADDQRAPRQIIDEVMFEIRDITGQTYCDRYAGSAPAGERSETAVVAHVGHAPTQHEAPSGAHFATAS